MRILSVILRVSLIPLSIISAQSWPHGYFMTKFLELNDFFKASLLSNEEQLNYENNNTTNMSSDEKKKKCSQFFKTRIFVNNDYDMNGNLLIKNQIENSEYDIREKEISILGHRILSHNCFSSKQLSFSFLTNFNEPDSYFALITHKNTMRLLAYIEKNAGIIEDWQIDETLYSYISNMKDPSPFNQDFLLKMKETDMFRICSAAATHVLPKSSYAEVYKVQTQAIHSKNTPDLPYITLRYGINKKYRLRQTLLHCLLTDEEDNQTPFYIMLHPLEQNGAYIIQKTKNTFRLKVRLEEVEKHSIYKYFPKRK